MVLEEYLRGGKVTRDEVVSYLSKCDEKKAKQLLDTWERNLKREEKGKEKENNDSERERKGEEGEEDRGLECFRMFLETPFTTFYALQMCISLIQTFFSSKGTPFISLFHFLLQFFI